MLTGVAGHSKLRERSASAAPIRRRRFARSSMGDPDPPASPGHALAPMTQNCGNALTGRRRPRPHAARSPEPGRTDPPAPIGTAARWVTLIRRLAWSRFGADDSKLPEFVLTSVRRALKTAGTLRVGCADPPATDRAARRPEAGRAAPPAPIAPQARWVTLIRRLAWSRFGADDSKLPEFVLTGVAGALKTAGTLRVGLRRSAGADSHAARWVTLIRRLRLVTLWRR